MTGPESPDDAAPSAPPAEAVEPGHRARALAASLLGELTGQRRSSLSFSPQEPTGLASVPRYEPPAQQPAAQQPPHLVAVPAPAAAGATAQEPALGEATAQDTPDEERSGDGAIAQPPAQPRAPQPVAASSAAASAPAAAAPAPPASATSAQAASAAPAPATPAAATTAPAPATTASAPETTAPAPAITAPATPAPAASAVAEVSEERTADRPTDRPTGAAPGALARPPAGAGQDAAVRTADAGQRSAPQDVRPAPFTYLAVAQHHTGPARATADGALDQAGQRISSRVERALVRRAALVTTEAASLLDACDSLDERARAVDATWTGERHSPTEVREFEGAWGGFYDAQRALAQHVTG